MIDGVARFSPALPRVRLTQKSARLDLAAMMHFLAGVPGWVWGVLGVVALMVTIYYGRKAATARQVRVEIKRAQGPAANLSDKDEPLVDYRQFYGDELGERHEFDFIRERAEHRQVGDKVEVKATPLEDVLGFIAGPRKMLVVCGSGGLGKSRLLIEAAKSNRHLRFAQTRLFSKNLPGLAALIRDRTHKSDIIVFDDCHEYQSDLESLLNWAMRAGARVIVATRYMGSIEEALNRVHATPEIVELAPMVNAAQIVPVPPDVRTEIARVSEFNPALAVMAYLHWQRHGSLVGILDSFGLMGRVFDDLLREGAKTGFRDTAEFLAEMAVRGGLFEDESPMPEHIVLATMLKPMGHVDTYSGGRKRVFRVVPDKLRDHVVRIVYGRAGFLQPSFDAMLARLPDRDAVSVIYTLGIQYRETGNDVWKQACGTLLHKYADMGHGAGIGFQAPQSRVELDLLVDVGYTAWAQFGDVSIVSESLGDFCAGAEKLTSLSHLHKAAMFCHRTGQLERAIACYERGEALAAEAGDTRWLASFLGNLGLVYRVKGRFEEALGSMQQVRSLTHGMGDKVGEAAAISNIGNIYADLGESDKALPYLEEGLAAAREIKDKPGEANQLGNIGLVHYHRGDFDRALEYFKEALAIDRQTGDREGEATTLGNIGLVYRGKGELDKAVPYIEEALAINRGRGHQQGVAHNLWNYGAVLVDAGKYDEAIPRFVEALADSLAVGMALVPGWCLAGLRACIEALGRAKVTALCEKNGMSSDTAMMLAEKLLSKPDPKAGGPRRGQ